MVFYAASAIAIAATLLMLTRLNAVHALLYLIISLIAVAVIFYCLGAPFVAALEVIIYAGAIMVLFVFVVGVDMVVIEQLMRVFVFMACADEQRHTNDHQRARDDVVEPEGFREHQRSEDGSDERRDSKDGRFPRCAEGTQGERVEVDREAVADSTEQQRGSDDRNFGEPFAEDQCQHQVDGSGNAGLDQDDRARVAQRQGLCEVVVECPRCTRGRDEHDAHPIGVRFACTEAEQERSRENHDGTGHRLSWEMLPEQRDPNHDRER